MTTEDLQQISEIVRLHIAPIHTRLVSLEGRMGNIEAGLDKVELRLDKVEKRLSTVERQLKRVKRDISYMSKTFDRGIVSNSRRIEKVEQVVGIVN